jgi:hypothetical protein
MGGPRYALDQHIDGYMEKIREFLGVNFAEGALTAEDLGHPAL